MFKHYTHAESIFVVLKIPNPEVRKYSRLLEQFESSSSVELPACHVKITELALDMK